MIDMMDERKWQLVLRKMRQQKEKWRQGVLDHTWARDDVFALVAPLVHPIPSFLRPKALEDVKPIQGVVLGRLSSNELLVGVAGIIARVPVDNQKRGSDWIETYSRRTFYPVMASIDVSGKQANVELTEFSPEDKERERQTNFMSAFKEKDEHDYYTSNWLKY